MDPAPEIYVSRTSEERFGPLKGVEGLPLMSSLESGEKKPFGRGGVGAAVLAALASVLRRRREKKIGGKRMKEERERKKKTSMRGKLKKKRFTLV